MTRPLTPHADPRYTPTPHPVAKSPIRSVIDIVEGEVSPSMVGLLDLANCLQTLVLHEEVLTLAHIRERDFDRILDDRVITVLRKIHSR